MDSNLATRTLADLQSAVTTAPDAVKELMREYDCEVPASAEALVLLAGIHGEAFVDDLYILLNQASSANQDSRFAGIDGVIEKSTPFTGTPSPNTPSRSTLGAGIQAVLDILNAQMGTKGTAGGVDYDANAVTKPEEPKPKILGLSQPVFIAGCAVLVLAVVVVLLSRKK